MRNTKVPFLLLALIFYEKRFELQPKIFPAIGNLRKYMRLRQESEAKGTYCYALSAHEL